MQYRTGQKLNKEIKAKRWKGWTRFGTHGPTKSTTQKRKFCQATDTSVFKFVYVKMSHKVLLTEPTFQTKIASHSRVSYFIAECSKRLLQKESVFHYKMRQLV